MEVEVELQDPGPDEFELDPPPGFIIASPELFCELPASDSYDAIATPTPPDRRAEFLKVGDKVTWSTVSNKKEKRIKKIEKLKSIAKSKKTAESQVSKAINNSSIKNDIATIGPLLNNKIPAIPVKNTVPKSVTQNVFPSFPTPSPMSQNVTHTPITRDHYDPIDCGPFLVYVELNEANGIGTTLHPLKFGSFLFKNKFTSILSNGIKKIGRNRLSVSFKSAEEANLFIKNDILRKAYKAYIPSHNISRMGIVRGIPSDWSHEEILESVQCPPGTGKILKTRRLSKKIITADGSSWTPTQTVVFTFDGQVLPKEIACCYTILTVDHYVFPTIQCFNCCRFGHTKALCRSKPKCFKCTDNHSGDSCLVKESDAMCLYCSAHHFATNKSCPEYSRQVNIKHYMANHNVSYQEAIQKVPQTKKSFAEALSSSPAPTQSTQQSSHLASSQMTVPTQTTGITQSYRKTIVRPPRPRPVPVQGYDQNAHKELIHSYDIPTPQNGCAINTNKEFNSTNNETLSPESINKLLSSLTNIILYADLPNDVAIHMINTISIALLNAIKHGCSPPVEL